MVDFSIKSLKAQSLRNILFTAFALIFTLPLLIFYFVTEHFGLIGEQIVLISFIGFLFFALVGFILLRQIVDQIINAVTGSEQYLDEHIAQSVAHERNELLKLTKTFETLAKALQESTNKLGHRISELSSLRELSELLSRSAELYQLFEKVLEKVMITTRSSMGMMASLSEDGRYLTVEAARGIDTAHLNKVKIDASRTVIGSALADNDGMTSADVTKVSSYNPDIDNVFSGPFMARRVTARGKTIGILALARGAGGEPYSEAERDYVTTALGQVAFAFDNAQLIRELKSSYEKLRRIQEKLIIYERASAVNQTVVTLSDQINSPLMVIQGHSELIRKRLNKEDEALEKSLDAIDSASGKCVEIMMKLRSIQNPSVKEYSPDGTTMIDIEGSATAEDEG